MRKNYDVPTIGILVNDSSDSYKLYQKQRFVNVQNNNNRSICDEI